MCIRVVCGCAAILVVTLAASPCANADNPVIEIGVTSDKPATGPSVKVDEGYMVPYVARIPGTDITFEMVPVPGGEYLMGSPVTEANRNLDEGPQIKVNVDPMWVAKAEVTWSQYREFMSLHDVFQGFQLSGKRLVDDSNRIDAVTAPTPLYDPTFTYGFGEEPEQPASTMTQYAAQQFTKWLSGICGVQYRLPTEAEWEYAARAGTATAFSWGDDDESMDDHAWNYNNAESDELPVVGTKEPNAFGLHDMHGSVGEWTINQYTEKGYVDFVDKQPINATTAVAWPSKESPCVIRGGAFQDDAAKLRSAARLASGNEVVWKDKDPNIPLSAWWFTNDPTRGIGFRLFRSYKPLPKETITKFWDTSAEDILSVVDFKINDGRAYLGLVDQALPIAIKESE